MPKLRLKPAFPAMVFFLAFLAFAPGRIIGVSLAFISGIVIISSLNQIPRLYPTFAWPLIGILALGIVSAPGHRTIDIARDLVFALDPIFLLFVGFWMARRQQFRTTIYDIIIYAGIIAAIYHLSKFVLEPQLLTLSIQDIRVEVWAGDASVTIALALLLFKHHFEEITACRFPAVRFTCIFLLALSMILSYSRAQFITFLILSVSLWVGTAERNKKVKILKAVFFLSLALLVLSITDEAQSFLEKFTRSFTEVKIDNYAATEDINANWRGLESFKAMETFKNADLFHKVFGGGLGTLVDLGWYMPLGDSELRFLPILHNGYAYIAIKFGVAGLLLYFIFFVKIFIFFFSQKSSSCRHIKLHAYLLLGCAISLALMMVVVGGMPQTGGVAQASAPSLIVLVGYAIQRIASARREIIEETNGSAIVPKPSILPYAGINRKRYFGTESDFYLSWLRPGQK